LQPPDRCVTWALTRIKVTRKRRYTAWPLCPQLLRQPIKLSAVIVLQTLRLSVRYSGIRTPEHGATFSQQRELLKLT
jgi:hypothetical protein